MGKSVFIAEKPSVAREFATALHENFRQLDGFMESENYIVTWCFGHLVAMSYPEVYNPNLKKWRLDSLPFIPQDYKYEIIASGAKQFHKVAGLLNREDVETIYVCTDSGREGEYIYRLVRQEAKVSGKKEKRVWIDSQTEEEIHKGIKNAKDLSEYDSLSDAAYCRAKEDYLMGINFSRVLTLKYGNQMAAFLNRKYVVIAVGRVMTCVLGMVVKREREIRSFVKTPFFKVSAATAAGFDAEWKVNEKSKYYNTPELYKDNGFVKEEKAKELMDSLSNPLPATGIVSELERKNEAKNAPLLYNLAEIQNDCSKMFKISPDQTLNIIQELYEKKLVTYPRTDARVLSTAVAKVIDGNIKGLTNFGPVAEYANEVLAMKSYEKIAKTRYTNDKQITDHYAIIPTGQGFNNLRSLSSLNAKVYELICRRFLSIFYPPAKYKKSTVTISVPNGEYSENFYASVKTLDSPGYLKVANVTKAKTTDEQQEGEDEESESPDLAELLKNLKKGDTIQIDNFSMKTGETSPPSRYNSGSMILAMENAGKLIEDETLREQIKSCGIGTSATRAEILKKLGEKNYIFTNQKTQILTPTLLGEMVYDTVESSIKPLLNPELTASWEKGLNYVADGKITSSEYMDKLEGFVRRRTAGVMSVQNVNQLMGAYRYDAQFYKSPAQKTTARKTSRKKSSKTEA